MGQATGRPDSETLDLVITNCLIVDWSGIYKVRRNRSFKSLAWTLADQYIAGRYWSQEPHDSRDRQGWESRCDGGSDAWDGRRSQHGGHRGREAHHHCWCCRCSRYASLLTVCYRRHTHVLVAVHYICPQLWTEALASGTVGPPHSNSFGRTADIVIFRRRSSVEVQVQLQERTRRPAPPRRPT